MKKWIKRLLYFLGFAALLIVLLLFLLHTEFAKNLIREKTQAYLREKLGADLRIGKLDYQLPNYIELNEVFLSDRQNDTLLYGSKIFVRLDMIGLLSSQYHIKHIELDDIVVKVNRSSNDSNYNFRFIADAFASPENAEASSKNEHDKIDLDIRQINLSNIHFLLNDLYGGTYANVIINESNIKLDAINLKEQIYSIDSFLLDGLIVDIVQSKQTIDQQEAENTNIPIVKANVFQVQHADVRYNNRASGMKSFNTLKMLYAAGIDFEQNTQTYSLQKLLLTDADVLFRHVSKTDTINTEVQQPEQNNLNFFVQALELQEGKVQYDNDAMPLIIGGLDYNHLVLDKVGFLAKDVYIGAKKMTADIRNIAFIDHSGFSIDSLRGNFVFNQQEMKIDSLLFKTPSSVIKGNARFDMSVFNAQNEWTQKDFVSSVNIYQTQVGTSDIQLLMPDLYRTNADVLNMLGQTGLSINVEGNGDLMHVRTLQSENKQFKVDVRGALKHWNDLEKFTYNLDVGSIVVSGPFVRKFLDDASALSLPPQLKLGGIVSGNMHTLEAKLLHTSDYGLLNIDGALSGFSSPETMQFDVRLNAEKLQTGKWIHDTTWGTFTGNIHVKSSGGFDYTRTQMSASMSASELFMNGNAIGPFNANVNVRNGMADFSGAVADEAVSFNMNGVFNLNEYPNGKANVYVNQISLQQLGLANYPLSLSLNTHVNLVSSEPEHLDLQILADSMYVQTEDGRKYIDSTIVQALGSADSTILHVYGGILNGNVEGDIQYTNLNGFINQILSRYGFVKAKQLTKIQEGTLDFNLSLSKNPLTDALFPEIQFSNVNLNGYLSNKKEISDSLLRINFNSGAVAYNDWQLNKTNIHLTGTENKLLFEGTVDSLRNSTITLHHLQTTGFYMDTSAQANVIVSDDKAKDMYVVSASMHTDDMGAHFHLQDNLVLNYDQWDVDESNRVVVQSSGFNVQQMRIGREGQLIHIQSDGEAAGAPLNIEIKDFQLSTLTRIINQDTLLADGSLNAKLKLQHFDLPVPYIQGNLEVDTLFVQGTELGNLKVGAVSENGKIDFEGLLSGTENHVEINGKYSEKLIDADIRLNPLSLKTIQSFSQGNLKNSSGNVSGDVKLTGPLSNPAWNGNVKFNDVSTRLTGYGSVLRIDDQEVALRYPEIVLNKFTVKDSLMNPLFIDGMVTVDDAFQIKPDLKISAKKFMLLDNKQSENEFIYGKAMIEINADVKGTVDAPVLTGNLILKNGSEVTYVRQTTSASLKERDEWIEFIDMDTIPDLLKYHTKGDVREISDRVLPGSSIKMDLDVSTETETVLNIVIDPVNKDKLSVQGEAGLNLSTSAGGEYLLTGLYELNKGSYQLKYGLINKDFKLQPGSFIQFNGNPMKAQAQITAIYELETSAGELIGNELNSEAGTTTSLNRKIPFQILLNIQGTVSKPQLSFDIKMQEKAEGVSYDIATAVDNKLQQLRNDPSAMNKQVFALLMFNRFIGEQSSDFFGGAGSVTTDNILANESVSAFLGAAIDKIAEDLISNVDIDVNIKNVENTSGNRRTDLNLALGSSFMNDRLTVTFGQRFTLDGQDPSAKSQNSKTQFIPNIQTTYKLSRDGRYMLRAYRMNQYEAIMDGYFIETGLTFTLKMDYDKFKELFKRSKK